MPNELWKQMTTRNFSLVFDGFSFFVALLPNAGYGLLIHEVSRSNTLARTPLEARRKDL